MTNDDKLRDEERKRFFNAERRRVPRRWDRIEWVIKQERKKDIARGRLYPLPMELYKNAVWAYIYSLYRSTQLAVSAGIESLFRSLVNENPKRENLYYYSKLAKDKGWISENTRLRVNKWKDEIRNKLLHGNKPYEDELSELRTQISIDEIENNTANERYEQLQNKYITKNSAEEGIELFQDIIVEVFQNIIQNRSPVLSYWDRMIKFHSNAERNSDENIKLVKFLSENLENLSTDDKFPIHTLNNLIARSPLPNQEWLENFAKKINAIKSINNYSKILNGLSNSYSYHQSSLIMDVICRLLQQGFEVNFYNNEYDTIKAYNSENKFKIIIDCNVLRKELFHQPFSEFISRVQSLTVGLPVHYSAELFEVKQDNEKIIYSSFLEELEDEILKSIEINEIKEFERIGVGRVKIVPNSIRDEGLKLTQSSIKSNYTDSPSLKSRILNEIDKIFSIINNEDDIMLIFDVTTEDIDLEEVLNQDKDEYSTIVSNNEDITCIILITRNELLFNRDFTNNETKTRSNKQLFVYRSDISYLDQALCIFSPNSSKQNRTIISEIMTNAN